MSANTSSTLCVAELERRARAPLPDIAHGAAARQHSLDRHWRNARTVANHSPRHWKAAAVGAHRLKAMLPPTSGLFEVGF